MEIGYARTITIPCTAQILGIESKKRKKPPSRKE
jgi:hypothetical protein